MSFQNQLKMHVIKNHMIIIRSIEIAIEIIKGNLNNENIKFARIEKYSNVIKIQWLLSIVLIREFTDDAINEIVVETILIVKDNMFYITTDLSYGNGLLIEESSLSISKEKIVNENKLANYLLDHLFYNINALINDSIVKISKNTSIEKL